MLLSGITHFSASLVETQFLRNTINPKHKIIALIVAVVLAALVVTLMICKFRKSKAEKIESKEPDTQTKEPIASKKESVTQKKESDTLTKEPISSKKESVTQKKEPVTLKNELTSSFKTQEPPKAPDNPIPSLNDTSQKTNGAVSPILRPSQFDEEEVLDDANIVVPSDPAKDPVPSDPKKALDDPKVTVLPSAIDDPKVTVLPSAIDDSKVTLLPSATDNPKVIIPPSPPTVTVPPSTPIDKDLAYKKSQYEGSPIWQYFVEYASALVERNRCDEAWKEYDKFLKEHPNSPFILRNYACHLFLKGEYEKAAVQGKKMLEIDPKDETGLINSATDYIGLLQKTRPDLVILSYEKLLELAPTQTRLLNFYALALYRAGKIEEVIAQYEKILDIDPTDAPTLRKYAEIKISQNKFDDVDIRYQKALQQLPSDPIILHYYLKDLMKQEKFKAAIEICEKLASIDAHDRGTKLNYAYALARTGKYDEAVAQCQLILAQVHDHVFALATLADIYAQQGKLQEAYEHYRKIGDTREVLKHLSSYDSALLKKYAELLRKLGKVQEAVIVEAEITK